MIYYYDIIVNEILALLIDKINENINETPTKIPLIRPETSMLYRRIAWPKHRGGETLFLTLLLLDVPTMKSHKGAEITKLIACKTFCHGISGHFVRRDIILEDDAAVFNAFPNEVMLDGCRASRRTATASPILNFCFTLDKVGVLEYSHSVTQKIDL